MAPPVAGEFTVIVRGNSSSDSTLLTRSAQVQVPEEVRRLTFIQVVTDEGSKRAAVASPNALLTVEWSLPLPAIYAICFVEGDSFPRVLVNTSTNPIGNQRAGSCTL